MSASTSRITGCSTATGVSGPFFEDADYGAYLAIAVEAFCRAEMETWGWCLMSNHVNLICALRGEDGLAEAVGATHWRCCRFGARWRLF